ncbi:hypothetical protein BRD01_15625 [Halobacteriales archaeon QS_8_65_32]|nr:MAG: hypothetical protein BRD01_15625 [Halobacteriales archaeon QS_8_65_32]
MNGGEANGDGSGPGRSKRRGFLASGAALLGAASLPAVGAGEPKRGPNREPNATGDRNGNRNGSRIETEAAVGAGGLPTSGR